MSGVVTIFKDGVFVHEQTVLSNPKEFIVQFLEANGIAKENVTACHYQRLPYLELLQKSKSSDIIFFIEPNRLLLKKKKINFETVQLEIDWLNINNLSDFYDADTIVKIEENRQWATAQGSLKNIDLSAFPHQIPVVTYEGQKEVVDYEFLEELGGTELIIQ